MIDLLLIVILIIAMSFWIAIEIKARFIIYRIIAGLFLLALTSLLLILSFTVRAFDFDADLSYNLKSIINSTVTLHNRGETENAFTILKQLNNELEPSYEPDRRYLSVIQKASTEFKTILSETEQGERGQSIIIDN